MQIVTILFHIVKIIERMPGSCRYCYMFSYNCSGWEADPRAAGKEWNINVIVLPWWCHRWSCTLSSCMGSVRTQKCTVAACTCIFLLQQGTGIHFSLCLSLCWRLFNGFIYIGQHRLGRVQKRLHGGHRWLLK